MSNGAKLEEIHKGIARCGGIIGTMIVKRSVSRVLLLQVRDTLKIVIKQIETVVERN